MYIRKFFRMLSVNNSMRERATPSRDKAWSQKSGNVRTSRQGAKNLQFLSGCNF